MRFRGRTRLSRGDSSLSRCDIYGETVVYRWSTIYVRQGQTISVYNINKLIHFTMVQCNVNIKCSAMQSMHNEGYPCQVAKYGICDLELKECDFGIAHSIILVVQCGIVPCLDSCPPIVHNMSSIYTTAYIAYWLQCTHGCPVLTTHKPHCTMLKLHCITTPSNQP